MITTRLLAWTAAALALAGPAPSNAQAPYMDLTFDGQAIDQRLGVGGTAIGQASFIHPELDATVRATPFASPSLELLNPHSSSENGIYFDLPGGSLTSGVVGVSLVMWIGSLSPAMNFDVTFMKTDEPLTWCIFNSAGNVAMCDRVQQRALAACPTGRAVRFVVAFDMAAGTWSAWWDGALIFADCAHGNATSNLASIWIRVCGPATSATDRLWIDRIVVTDHIPDVATKPMTWGRIRSLYGS
jgi:hypothetical protein